MWDFVKGVWDKIVKAAQDAWTWVTEAWSGAVAWFKDLWNKIKQTVVDVWNGIVDKVKGAWQDIKDVFKTAKEDFKQIWDAIWTGLTAEDSIFGKFKTTLSGISTAVSDVWTKAGDAIKKVFTGVVSYIKNIFSTVINFIVDKVNSVLATYNSVADSLKLPKAELFERIEVEVDPDPKTAAIIQDQVQTGIDRGFEKALGGPQSKAFYGFGGKTRTIGEEDLLKKSESRLRSEFFAAGGQELTRESSAETPVAQLQFPADMKSLTDAINNPSWWSGADGMKAQMESLREATVKAAEMQKNVLMNGFDGLAAAVTSSKGSPAGTTGRKGPNTNTSQVTSLGAVNGEGMR
jgi:hypothetical protein